MWNSMSSSYDVIQSELSINFDILPFKIFFAFFYSGLYGIFTFSGLYYKEIGLQAHEIGFISGVRHACAIVILPLIGPITDLKNYRRAILIVFIVTFACASTPVGFVPKPESCCKSTSNVSNVTTSCYEINNDDGDSCCRLTLSNNDQQEFGYIQSDVLKVFIVICVLNGLGELSWMPIRIIGDVCLFQALGSHSDRYGTTKVFGAIGSAIL
ncbi:major facilitator superfamily domain-containing protein 6-like [Antedon mediterranea]|uniref:major facilitator superfamily domain-containing protein 6-like n=1 Tax=Antedon mediterranea TaxID=105859 RepID=UPI003AF8E0E0